MTIHFWGGLFFLVLVIAVIFSYFLAAFGGFLVLRWLIRVRRLKKAGQRWQDYVPRPFTRNNIRVMTLVFIFVFVFNALFYLRQRAVWMGDDNAHLTAKEYYVAGQVLYLYRSILTDLLHPDNWLLLPMNGLQEIIFNVGSKYLPEGDGEIGIWMDTWLVYPYSKKFRLPDGYIPYVNRKQVAPMLVKFLDRAWFAIENLATKTIADRQMYEQHYLRNFAGMVHFYAYWEGYYTGRTTGAAFIQSKIPEFIHRSEKMIVWLEELKERWQASEKTRKFLQRHPEVEVMRQVALIMELSDILLARIDNDNFSCQDPLWTTYQQVRKEFSEGADGEKTALQRMTDEKKAKQFEYVVLNSEASKCDWYVLYRYCEILLPGKADWSSEIGRARARRISVAEFLEYNYKNVLFKDQMIKLEEQFNGNK